MLREISAQMVSFTAVLMKTFERFGEIMPRTRDSASSDSLDNLTQHARRGRIASVDEST